MSCGFVLDHVGKLPRVIGTFEQAVTAAKAMARARGEAVPICSMADIKLATVWPDGKVDLTAEGSRIA